ncbi:MAG TPA: hypothetical protein VJB88_05775 [Vicinamibacteria bacterium]|nr:hypothetical protein [Vicinamibacteria bacterium]
MMARTQVSLDLETLKRARKRAAELGISFAEYLRRLVARDLGKPKRRADPSAVFNLGDSGGTDVARQKDALVGEAFSAEGHSERRHP